MELKTKTQSSDIPSEWSQTPLGSVCTLHNGRAFHRSEWESRGTPVIRLQNLTGGDDYYYSTLNLPPNKYCSEGDLLYMWSATFGPKIWKGPRAIYHYHIWKVDVKESVVSRNFLYFKLDEITQRLKERETSGSTMLHLTKQKMENIDVLLPPLPEQRAIADALSDVDALIDRLDALIAKKRNVKTATMQRLLTGKERLPGFDETWKKKRLGSVVDVKAGQSPRSIHYNESREGLPLVQGKADLEGRKSCPDTWTTHSPSTCEKGDLILTVRAPVGHVAMAAERICLGRGVCALRPEAADSRFLFQLLIQSEDRWKTIEQGSTFTSASAHQVRDFEIEIPNSKEEQRAIATILSDMDAEIAVLEKRREKTKAVKTGMMQELLTGKTRLQESAAVAS